jgi:hypothetical protein
MKNTVFWNSYGEANKKMTLNSVILIKFCIGHSSTDLSRRFEFHKVGSESDTLHDSLNKIFIDCTWRES